MKLRIRQKLTAVPFAIASLALMAFSACTKSGSHNEGLMAPIKQEKDNGGAPPAVPAATKTIIESALDQTADPCEDFYQYACGGWLSKFQLPADRSGYFMKGSSIEDEFVTEMIGFLNQEARAKTDLGNLYSSCLNRDQFSAHQKQTLKALLDQIKGMKNLMELPSVLAELHKDGVKTLFEFFAMASFQDSSVNIAHLVQNPMTLPEKDFYFSDSSEMQSIRTDYVKHIALQLVLSGYKENSTEALATASDILNLEINLAQNENSNGEAWNPDNANNPRTYKELTQSYLWNWDIYLKAMGLAKPEDQKWNVQNPKYFEYFVQFINETEFERIQNLLAWKTIIMAAPIAGGDLESENFNFWKLRLRGQKVAQSKEKSCLRTLENYVPDNLALLFIQNHPEAEDLKKSGNSFVLRVKDAFVDNLQSVNWLSEETKAKVQKKINQMGFEIAYADKYSPLKIENISSDNFLAALVVLNQITLEKNLSDIGKPVDNKKWDMQPYVDNAYYSREQNKMVLPYTNWVPPYYDPKGSDAANMGSISYVAHELTHGFDANGSQYDENGNISGWWTDSEKKSFDDLNQCYIDQANAYKVKQGWNLKGSQIIDENLADQGGLKLVYIAYQKMKSQLPSVSGSWTPDQQFFVAYAQSWCVKETDQSIYTQINSDEHAPVEFRVNGVVMNRPEFAAAFNCKPGQRLNPTNKCQSW